MYLGDRASSVTTHHLCWISVAAVSMEALLLAATLHLGGLDGDLLSRGAEMGAAMVAAMLRRYIGQCSQHQHG